MTSAAAEVNAQHPYNLDPKGCGSRVLPYTDGIGRETHLGSPCGAATQTVGGECQTHVGLPVPRRYLQRLGVRDRNLRLGREGYGVEFEFGG